MQQAAVDILPPNRLSFEARSVDRFVEGRDLDIATCEHWHGLQVVFHLEGGCQLSSAPGHTAVPIVLAISEHFQRLALPYVVNRDPLVLLVIWRLNV